MHSQQIHSSSQIIDFITCYKIRYFKVINFTAKRKFMYSKEETQQLQKQAITFIKHIDNSSFKSSEIEALRNVLRFHEYRYYVLNEPLISDFEYDQLFKALQKMEEEDPLLLLRILLHNG